MFHNIFYKPRIFAFRHGKDTFANCPVYKPYTTVSKSAFDKVSMQIARFIT